MSYLPTKLAKILTRYLPTKLAKILTRYLPNFIAKPNIYLPYLTPIPLIPGMDTSTGPARKNLRASITKKYEERVASTTEKLDPHRARARELLGNVDNFELEELAGNFSVPNHHANEDKVAYMEAPLLTLRELLSLIHI